MAQLFLVPRILKELGFENVYIVKEQEEPDFNFPTVSYQTRRPRSL